MGHGKDTEKEHMRIQKPIFVVGCGRSGTTVLYNILSTHPDVCWFSNYTDTFPESRLLPLLHGILDLPVVGANGKLSIVRSTGTRFGIRPVEAQNIYHTYCGFKHAVKTTEDDWNFEVENKFKEVVARHLSLTRKTRFLTKQTANNQRIRLIHRMFRDAYCVHIIRDGRAVANSLLNVPWWNDTDIWWLGNKASAWEREGREPIELCALHWKRDVEEIQTNKALFGERYIELRYEDLMADVKGTVSRITDFCELRRSTRFAEALPQVLRNMNYKWKEQLTEEQKMILNRTLDSS
jgi:hypothetical protein